MADARFTFRDHSFRDMSDFFHRFGFLVVDDALPPDLVARLRADLHAANGPAPTNKKKAARHTVHKCFFEQSRATGDVVESSQLADLAQFCIADVPTGRPGGNSLAAHLVHNNAYSVPPGGRGQAPSWHVDDPLQQIIVPDGCPALPASIRLPILMTTCMVWLSDCERPENGPTFVAPGSHRSGKVVNPDMAEQRGIPMCGKAGTAVFLNPNTWHRGSHNASDVARDTLQLTFARRIVGHKFKSIMNYAMPARVLEGRSEKAKERFGFLEGGAYS
jgi:ectoine hydroxylase-related dioxygenase (phytanoyl-CoA dioxygenase family)